MITHWLITDYIDVIDVIDLLCLAYYSGNLSVVDISDNNFQEMCGKIKRLNILLCSLSWLHCLFHPNNWVSWCACLESQHWSTDLLDQMSDLNEYWPELAVTVHLHVLQCICKSVSLFLFCLKMSYVSFVLVDISQLARCWF